MVAAVVSFSAFSVRQAGVRPWLNHELAELYRVVDLFGQSGLELATDLGMTDEGDPWFVFCRADTGDVVFHIARIGQQYIAASSFIDQTYRGANFREIIDQMIKRQPLMVPPPSAKGKLFMHPAAVLAAIVAVALMHSHHADAAESPGHAVPVSLGADHPDHQDASSAPSKAVHHVETAKISLDKILAQIAAADESVSSMSSLASMIVVAYAAFAPLAQQAAADEPILVTHSNASDGAPAAHSPAATELAPNPIADSLVVSGPTADVDTRQATDAPADHGAISVSPTMAPISLVALIEPQKFETAAVVGPALPSSADSQIPQMMTIHQTGGKPDGAIIAAQLVSQNGTSVSAHDQGHHFDLSIVDPQALAVIIPHTDEANGQLAAHSTGGTSTSSSSSSGTSAVGSVNSGGTSTSGSQGTVVVTHSAADVIDALASFAFSPSHQLTGLVSPSSALASFLSSYAAANGGNVEVVVFDSASISLSMFPLVKGVVLVDDHQLAVNPQTLTAGSPVTIDFADGGSMNLIGIINVTPTHPLGS